MSKRSRKRREERLRRERKLASARNEPLQLRWRDQPEASRLALLESQDGFAGLRNGLRDVASAKGEWAGIPMPLEGERLVVEEKYPYADLAKIGASQEESPDDDGCKIRNWFYSNWRRCEIGVYEKDGRVSFVFAPAIHSARQQLHTLGCSEAWGIAQESNALRTLSGLLRHHQMKQYLLTGSFLETSERSGVTYMFRKLRPTIAIRPDKNGGTKILCTLCLHPIAYYAGSWSGAMCPTDDVIAHLMLARGDEPMFWRRANQHPAYRPEAGI